MDVLDAADRPCSEHAKADFSSIYDQPGPEDYYATLAPLDYRIPDLARPVVAAVHDAAPDGPLLDVCCSYGVNAVALRHDLDFAGMAEHLRPGPGLVATRRFLDDRPRAARPDVLGLDSSAPAVRWAGEAGLLSDGWAEDLEEREPSPELAAGIAGVTTLCCTGGVGYVTATTFDRILASLDRPEELHAVLFVLRVFDVAPIVEVFAGHGLVTEQLRDVTFAQRRLAEETEAAAAVRDVRARGLDPAGLESAGWFHADCFVTRPSRAVAATPLDELLAGVAA